MDRDDAEDKHGRCSWCKCIAMHAIVTVNTALNRRSIFKCRNCDKRTLPCRAPGCDAFAKGGVWLLDTIPYSDSAGMMRNVRTMTDLFQVGQSLKKIGKKKEIF